VWIHVQLIDEQDAGYKILQDHMSSVSQEPQLTISQPTNHAQHFHLSRSHLSVFILIRTV